MTLEFLVDVYAILSFSGLLLAALLIGLGHRDLLRFDSKFGLFIFAVVSFIVVIAPLILAYPLSTPLVRMLSFARSLPL
jgi:hypothetical protein